MPHPHPDGGSATDVRVRVATFNIHHGVGANGHLDLQRTAAAIAETDADVIGLQEVDRWWSKRSGFADQAGDLAELLGLHLAFGATLSRNGSDAVRPRQEYGVALLSRHRITAVRHTLLPRPRGGEQRGLLDAEIVVGGATLRCLCTHLQHRSPRARGQQATAIGAAVGTDETPTVLLGDLNARPDAPEVQALAEHLVDAWPDGGDGPGFTYHARKPAARIDYVLASPGIEVERAQVVDADASDHLPVSADLRLPPAHR